MSSSSSKKFKPVKGKAVEDAEEFSYDEIEETKVDRSQKKRKSASSVSSEPANKKRTSSASTTSAQSNASSRKGSKTVTTTKHQYPTTEYEPSEQLLDSAKAGTGHHALLNGLLGEILSEERATLTQFAQSDKAKSIHGKKYIFESLDDVLTSLLEEANNLPQDVQYEPELSKSERSELKPLLETKRLLEEHSRKLQVYENDTEKLVVDHDLWLGSQLVQDKLDSIPKRPASVTERETRSHYQQLLAALEHHCAQIIASAEHSQQVVAQARQVQERLYDAFNKARLDAANVKAPKDTRDLLKRMPALF